MQYRNDRRGNPLSQLGFGCMRFERSMGKTDIALAEKQLMAALKAGVNYFDTAYVYGDSEAVIGEIFQRNHCRDQLHIATKLPHYLLRKPGDIERYFSEQLSRLRTDYVDYYLMHMLPDLTTWNRLKSLGVLDWIAEKKASGAIRNIGFSYHGNTASFISLLEDYDWDFCQIQYNYIDEHTQAGRRGLERAHEMGIPVIIMEPLRGGRLVNALPEKALRRFQAAKPSRSPAEWGLCWLWNQPEVTVVLSGMNTLDMVEENCRIADQAMPGQLSEEDFQMYEDVKAAINEKIKVGCTGCGYCMPCPMGVDIPGSFRCYNARYTEGFYTGMKEYFMCTTLRGKLSSASQCIKCGKCESHCPQSIPIRRELENVVRVMENPVYHAAKGIAKLVGKF
ncbi:MAG: aldo/keto reductase [Oscillospiraceae bacterium]|nr:aldo/keto reductase [Oscillospiraceae bacterium]